jgi:EAL domain-containing protein (putative c-di-GMP-specific phosphodiesterase class I)
VDQLKLDRSFTEEVCHGPAGEAVAVAVVQLARALSLDVVAEGVETPGQRVRLVQLGYSASQGYLFGRAQPARVMQQRVLTSGAHAARQAVAGRTAGGPLTVAR